MSAVLPVSRWQARLELEFSQRLDRTIISHRRHEGPLVVQKPFYPEGGSCHVYLIHPPGGVVGGDHLALNVTVTPQAHALLTTPAANKFYRSAGHIADVVQHFYVDDAVLEWLPQENILFNHSHVNMRTRVELGTNARYLGWEVQCLGRPASHEVFNHGCLRQHLELWQNHKPLFIDRSMMNGESELMQAPWGLAGYSVMGTFVVFPAGEQELELARAVLNRTSAALRVGATLIGKVLVCRGLAHQAEPLRQLFIDVWSKLRPAVINKDACPPRIWNT